MSEILAEDIRKFWLKDCKPEDWYVADPKLDAEIIHRFGGAWHRAKAGASKQWQNTPDDALAYVILTDQFPRNMFRGEGNAFASDRLALATAKTAVSKGFDLEIEEPARQFFYLPFEHSENLDDQDMAVELIGTRLNSEKTLLHAHAHREIIRRFGRFPFRNAALARTTTSEECVFLESGGYGAIVRALSA